MQKYDNDRYLESYIGQHGVLLLCSRCCIGGKLLSALLLCGVMGGVLVSGCWYSGVTGDVPRGSDGVGEGIGYGIGLGVVSIDLVAGSWITTGVFSG